ncbi:uncharacterized protein FTOL_13993 [Fusarium torulosum]|uniref:Uncharacterized protein n=1 Tax=Fusarium torulosum TaxID=33205 RepID=A0AAE8MN49_9HYPO|nr:uncharacterized protein FTOL_13993 [Fusarium torulosum]
MLLLIYKLIN